jgi:pilus assembly protein TadC
MAEGNIIIRFIDMVGFKTLDTADTTRRMFAEASFALREQEEAVTTIMEKSAKQKEDRKRAMEDRLEKIRESVSVTSEFMIGDEERMDLEDREELKVPFSVRLGNILADTFSTYSKAPTSFFGDIQESLYKANILMPASKYIAISVGIGVIVAAAFALLSAVLLSTMIGVTGGVLGTVLFAPVFFLVLLIAKIYPNSKIKGRSDSFGREMPFALRHMATQLSSGSGLLETMRSVSVSDYGVLSEEFKKAILEIERGATIEEAFERMNIRIDSPGLKKASRQISSTLRTGGNLANTLKIIAEEVATEMRMKLKDFIQVLNTFSLMYMFITVVAPVLITTLVIAMGIAMKGMPLGSDVMWMLYVAFFGIAIYLSFMVKKFEPKV